MQHIRVLHRWAGWGISMACEAHSEVYICVPNRSIAMLPDDHKKKYHDGAAQRWGEDLILKPSRQDDAPELQGRIYCVFRIRSSLHRGPSYATTYQFPERGICARPVRHYP